jgi:fructose-bisphosphate aldolase class II
LNRTGHQRVVSLRELLPAAEAEAYAVGSFAPRYLRMIRHVLRAAQALASPLIVQISGNELRWFETAPREFADEFYTALRDEGIDVPVALHLDHTKDLPTIEAAIAAGFTSIMIDRSELPYEDNVTATRAVVEIARPMGVSVEGELGRIFSADKLETAEDQELYTVPEEAARFAESTGVDALAVSVGTAHGVYNVRQPRIDYGRLVAIRQLTPVHLVLHGGSGIPPEMVQAAIRLPGGGVSKINIATDLEQGMLAALGWDERTSNAALAALPRHALELAGAAVESVVTEKISRHLRSARIQDKS